MTTRLDALERVVAAGTATAALVLVPGVPAPLRAIVMVGWALVVPGLAWVRELPLHDPVEQGAGALALSLAALVLVGVGLLYTGIDVAAVGAVALAGIAVAGLATTRRRRARA